LGLITELNRADTCLRTSHMDTHQVQNHRVSVLFPLSEILNNLENITFWKLDLYPSSVVGRDKPTLLGPCSYSLYDVGCPVNVVSSF
jgi:hypothetical protein